MAHLLSGMIGTAARLGPEDGELAGAVASDLEDSGLTAGFSTRRGGVSRPPFDEANISLRVGDEPAAVEANRAALVEAVGLGRAPLATVRQHHSAVVVPVAGVPGMPAPAADGMITSQPGLALLVGVADCVPVLLLDPSTRTVGVLHVGWRNLVGGVVHEGLRVLAALGGRLGSVVALVGPAIGPCCYAVGSDVRDRVATELSCARAEAADGRPSLDLSRGVEQALEGAGVRRTVMWRHCTACSPETFFSKRRVSITGVQAGIVGVLAPLATSTTLRVQPTATRTPRVQTCTGPEPVGDVSLQLR